MMGADHAYAEVLACLDDYFDGLYRCDAALLERVFHPEARYVGAPEGALVFRSMAEYLPIVAGRVSGEQRREARADRVEAIEFAGPHVAMARVRCRIGPRFFTDFLSMIKDDGRWRIVAKVFHTEIQAEGE